MSATAEVIPPGAEYREVESDEPVEVERRAVLHTGVDAPASLADACYAAYLAGSDRAALRRPWAELDGRARDGWRAVARVLDRVEIVLTRGRDDGYPVARPVAEFLARFAREARAPVPACTRADDDTDNDDDDTGEEASHAEE